MSGSVVTPGYSRYTATAAGPSAAGAISALGNGVAAQQGGTATVTDLAFPADDPRGAGFAAAALPLLIAGILPAVGLLRLFPGHQGLRTRLLGAALFSLVAGASVAAYLQYFTGTLAGDYWANAATLSLGMAALSFTFLGLESLLGWPGLGLGIAIVMLLGNPLSAIASGPYWLPDGWSTLGQLLPPAPPEPCCAPPPTSTGPTPPNPPSPSPPGCSSDSPSPSLPTDADHTSRPRRSPEQPATPGGPGAPTRQPAAARPDRRSRRGNGAARWAAKWLQPRARSRGSPTG